MIALSASLALALALAVSGCGGTGTVAVPPAPRGSRVIAMAVRPQGTGFAAYVPVTIHGHEFMLRVDTGAVTTILTTAAERILRLPTVGAHHSAFTVGCQTDLQPVRVGRWRLGRIGLAPATIGVSDVVTGMSRVDGVPVGGLLGAGTLVLFHRVAIEFATGRLVLGGTAELHDGVRFRAISESNGGVAFLVRASIHGHGENLLVDSGASGTTLSAAVARHLGLPHLSAALHVKGAAGCSVPATAVKLTDWKLGDTDLPTTLVIALGSESSRRTRVRVLAAGLLGSDVLSHYRSVTLDFRTDRLQLADAMP